MNDASGGLRVADIIITHELDRRPSRTPDYRAENEALAVLADELAERPHNLLQKLTDTLVETGIGGSAGISLRGEAGGAEQFRWAALSGEWGRFRGGTMPFDASPWGVVIERDAPLLLERPERFFPAADAAHPPIQEVLLVPFHARGRPVGMLWVLAHGQARKFDAEDVRLLKNLARFAAAGHATSEALGAARANERASRRALEANLAGTRRLYELHGRLATETDLSAALDEILAAACAFTQTDRGCVQLVSDDGERLEMFAYRGYGPDSSFIRHFLHEGCKPACDAARTQRQRMVIDDVESFPPLQGTRDRQVALGDGIRATQSTPMVSRQGETLGVLSTQFGQPGRPTDERLKLVDLLAWAAADFVQRHRTEEALRASEQRLAADLASMQHLQTISGELVGEHDPLTRYERIVEAAATLTGSDAASLQELHADTGKLRLLAWRGFHPESAAFWAWVRADTGSSCGRALMAGERFVVPDMDRFDGEPEDVEAYRRSGLLSVQSTPLRAHSGQVVGMLSTHRRDRHTPTGTEFRFFDVLARLSADLIERVQVNERLRESEALLGGFGEASSDVLWIRNAETLQWEYLSPAFETIYGVSVQDALTGDTLRNWADLVIEEDRERAVANISRVRDGERVRFEYRVRRPDGELRWLRDTDFPMRGPSGEVERIGGVGQDVTDLKTTEIALRDGEGRLNAIIETARDYAILTLDADGRVSGWWTGAEAVFGYAVGEIVGRDGAILWSEEDRARGEPEKERAVARERGRAPDVRWHVRKDGTRVFIEGMVTPLLDPEGQITSYLKVGRDMTERHAADRHQEVLVAELQHRTRNLIAVVRSIAQQTMAATGPTDEFRGEFNHRLEALSRVQGLLSRSEEEPVTIEGLIRMELDALGVRDGANGRVVLDGPVVRLRNSLVQTLALALHELATNARKHGALSTGEGRLGVAWRVREADGERRRLALDWTETGAKVPIDTNPERRGYGRELIERALPYALGATTTYELRAGGARCTIDVPLERRERRRRGR